MERKKVIKLFEWLVGTFFSWAVPTAQQPLGVQLPFKESGILFAFLGFSLMLTYLEREQRSLSKIVFLAIVLGFLTVIFNSFYHLLINANWNPTPTLAFEILELMLFLLIQMCQLAAIALASKHGAEAIIKRLSKK
ncbi:MAG: hypothetical protein K9G33_02310 [Sneathiella sp.]|nr:hypothetical protein [Sneathiella sp.]